MRGFFGEPRHAAGFHVLIFYINVFNKPHKGLRRGVLMYVEEVSPRRTQLIGKKAISGWKLARKDNKDDNVRS